jgi:hypothetical protein
MIGRSLALVMMVGLGVAHAEPPAAPAIQNTFGFDVFKPTQACAKVTGALLAKLKAYRCGPSETGTASGKPTVATCKAKRGHSEYMLFATAADCTEERETQLANGAGE